MCTFFVSEMMTEPCKSPKASISDYILVPVRQIPVAEIIFYIKLNLIFLASHEGDLYTLRIQMLPCADLRSGAQAQFYSKTRQQQTNKKLSSDDFRKYTVFS